MEQRSDGRVGEARVVAEEEHRQMAGVGSGPVTTSARDDVDVDSEVPGDDIQQLCRLGRLLLVRETRQGLQSLRGDFDCSCLGVLEQLPVSLGDVRQYIDYRNIRCIP